MGKRYSVESTKAELVGKHFNWLTVIDVIKDSDNRVKCLCKCRCGKEKLLAVSSVIKESVISCGCYARSKERSVKCRQWRVDNPDKCRAQVEKHRQWINNNPDKVKEIADAGRSWHINNNDKVANNVSKYLTWCKENPDKIKEKGNRHSKMFRNKRLLHLSNYDLSIIHPDDLQAVISGSIINTDSVRTKCPQCGEYDYHLATNVFHYCDDSYKRIALCRKCNAGRVTSKYEQEIADYISTLYNGECIRNSRNIISPLEIDIFYPDRNIAIEFNGDYWHSLECGVDKEYHYNKFKICNEKGIRLISIFEHQWVNDNYAIKVLLSNIFCNCKVINCDECEIRRLNKTMLASFINGRSLKKSVDHNIAYGLYYNNDLIEVMYCFNNVIIDFVIKESYTVINGESALFNRFMTDTCYKEIIAYSNNNLSSGSIYKMLNFNLISDKIIESYTVGNFTICDCGMTLWKYSY